MAGPTKVSERTISALRTALIAIVGMACVTSAQNEYSDANRRIFNLPSEAALGYSNLPFARDGGPNTNPANLTLDSGAATELSYAGFFRNAYSASLLSHVAKIGENGAVGVSLSYLYVPDILVTWGLPTDADGNPIGMPTKMASMSETYLHVAYGHTWGFERVRLDAGAAIHALRRRLPDEGRDWTGYGIGADAGVAAGFTRTGIRVAFLVENVVTSYMNWSATYDETVYPHLRFGAGWKRDLPYIYGSLQLSYTSPDLLGNEGANATDYLDVSDSLENPRQLTLTDDPAMLLYGNYGIEYGIAQTVYLRVGLENLRQFTFGAGVALFRKRLTVDFAYLTHDLAGSYLMSLGYRW